MDPDLICAAAQMLMLGFRGLSAQADDPILEMLKLDLGGVILFDRDVVLNSDVRNVASAQQLSMLTSSLRSEAVSKLIIAVDQEGGRVCRLRQKHGFYEGPSAFELGSQRPAVTAQAATVIAKSLSAVGINLNLAPVVDLNANPENPVIARLERSYSSDPSVVTEHARGFVTAHLNLGIGCALKHFPGHGSSTQDSHLEMVDVSHSWSEDELLPYIHMIQTDLPFAVMTAHVFNSALDTQYPATLSYSTITDTLRKKIGFDGVVLSDDLQMNAITRNYGFGHAVKAAILAGVDMILIGNNLAWRPDIGMETIRLIVEAVEQGEIPRKRIEDSVRRISAFKKELAG